jgi:hypothetical protein
MDFSMAFLSDCHAELKRNESLSIYYEDGTNTIVAPEDMPTP